MKKIIKEYVPQVILIVFSVVLGLYLNQILVAKNEQAKANELLTLVIEEIRSNNSLITEWHSYHKSMKANFELLKNDSSFISKFKKEKEILLDTLLTEGTFMQNFPSTSAWEITKSNPLVSNIDYKNMKLLTDVYNAQEKMFEPIFKMFDLFNSTGVNKKEVAKDNLNIMFFSLKETVGREIYYTQLCDSALAKIKIAN